MLSNLSSHGSLKNFPVAEGHNSPWGMEQSQSPYHNALCSIISTFSDIEKLFFDRKFKLFAEIDERPTLYYCKK